MKPYCFVLMPFGTKIDGSGRKIHFDAIYEQIIKPSVINAGLEPIRADEEKYGGIIHKAMFERLMMCEYAIADLTSANANVFYELGIRHGVRPHSTTLIFSDDNRLPFDVSLLRALPYQLDRNGFPENADSYIESLTGLLASSRDQADDSPVYQLVSDMPRVDIDRGRSDSFREAVAYDEGMKSKLRYARCNAPETLKEIEGELEVQDASPAILIDLLLSYRSVKKWPEMISLIERLRRPLCGTVLIQEQYAFALNRHGKGQEAERVLLDVIRSHGASSETNGLLGRVYKDRWESVGDPSDPLAVGYLEKAIDAYIKGFEADLRDPYPGINAVTLMEMRPEEDPRKRKIIPVVRYSAERRIEESEADYWDYATLLELCVIDEDEAGAQSFLGHALASVREGWEKESTAKNIRLLMTRKERAGKDVQWICEILDKLERS